MARMNSYLLFERADVQSDILAYMPNLREIDDYAFFGQKAKSAIIIPSKVTKIGQAALQLYGAVPYIYIPDSVTEIHKDFANGGTKIMCSEKIKNLILEAEGKQEDTSIYKFISTQESIEGSTCKHNYQTISHFDATCVESGETILKCTKCNKEINDTIDPYGHNYSRSTIDTNGCKYVSYFCTKCGIDRYEDEGTFVISGETYPYYEQHNYQIIESTKIEATCSQNGSYTEKCLVCGFENQVIVQKVPHNIIKQDDGSFKCSGCNGTFSSTMTITNTQNDSPYYFRFSEDTYTSNNSGINASTAQTTLTINVEGSITLKIDWSVSSEANWDKLTIIVDDNNVVDNKSGIQNGVEDIMLSEGEHTIILKYCKDSSAHKNEDRARVKIICEPLN